MNDWDKKQFLHAIEKISERLDDLRHRGPSLLGVELILLIALWHFWKR
jgi:hypothetical protein